MTELDNGKRKGYMLDTSVEPVKMVLKFINEIEARKTQLHHKKRRV